MSRQRTNKSTQHTRVRSREKVKASKTPPERVRARIPLTRRDRMAGKWFAKLVALQARLYGPGGCPWDREQTHESLRKYLIEETYETLDAMESGNPRQFAGELGDLLLQVIFHAVLAEKNGEFSISDVIEAIHSKMIRRHPHVFGRAVARDARAVLRNWEQIKAEERAAEKAASRRAGSSGGGKSSLESVLSGVPRSLPGVLEAYQLARRASHVGFDWINLQEVLEKLDEEIIEIRESALPKALNGEKQRNSSLKTEEEVGDLLFTAVNVARFLGVDPEIALKKANRKFKQRFQSMEAAAEREGHRFADLPRPHMEELWNAAKVP